jgi:hypothetical protein
MAFIQNKESSAGQCLWSRQKRMAKDHEVAPQERQVRDGKW